MQKAMCEPWKPKVSGRLFYMTNAKEGKSSGGTSEQRGGGKQPKIIINAVGKY
jgi:hypothetical protein